MHKQVTGIVVMAMVVACGVTARGDVWDELRSDVGSDYRNFYTAENLAWLGGGLAVGGVIANTTVDEDFQEWYQDDVRSNGSDDLADFSKMFGEGLYTVPLFAGCWAIRGLAPDSEAVQTISEWGERSIRSMLVGAPPMLVLQAATGASRPSDNEDDPDSSWQPFADGNGVSGHSFMGSVPFLAAASMTENRGLKAAYVTGSLLCGFSRVNDDDHFLSQSMLGWWIAYLSVQSVAKTEDVDRMTRFEPAVIDGAPGICLSMRF